MAPRVTGYANGMNETESNQQNETTSPPEDTHEATTPPGNGEPDTEAGRKVEEQLEQAGGGH